MSLGYFFKAGAALEPQGRELYEQYPVMRRWCDEAAGWIGTDIDELLSLEITTDELGHLPLVRSIVVSLGVVDVLAASGIEPRVICGYSSGLMVAACAAGAIERKDLLDLTERIRMAQDLGWSERSGGVALLAFPVDTDESVIASFYGPQWPHIHLAADSGLTSDGNYRMITVSGDLEELQRMAATVPPERVRVNPTFGALHSPLSQPLRDFMEPYVTALPLREPKIPLYAGFAPEPLTAADLAPAFLRNYTDPIRLDHLRGGMKRHGVRLAIAPGPGKPLQMSALQWPFEVVEVLTPADIAHTLSTVHELAVV